MERVPTIEVDDLGDIARKRFEIFLQNFLDDSGSISSLFKTSEKRKVPQSDLLLGEQDSDGSIRATQEETPLYLLCIDYLVRNESSTLYVDFNHVMEFDHELAEAIEQHYYRLNPFLRKSLENLIKKRHPELFQPEDLLSLEEQYRDQNLPRNQAPAASISRERPLEREYWVAFHNVNPSYKIRELKTNKIGRLCAIHGTVTRTSEVRPELLYGYFQCCDCGITIPNIEQQFRYTEPLRCTNAQCVNNIRWQLNFRTSKFVDWQKVRMQENSEEIPSGSMPRSIDIVLRHEEVEKAKAGDKCVFVGTLLVIPDVSKGGRSIPGPSNISKKHKLNTNSISNNRRNGNRNLEINPSGGQAASEFNYRLCFLASTVYPSDTMKMISRQISVSEMFRQQYRTNQSDLRNTYDGLDSTDSIFDEFTEEEIEEIRQIRGGKTSNIYRRLVNSIAPAVFGHQDVKKGILLMLFGGVHKLTSDSINLRGDINVCIVGDPSTSKSQFLKYVVSFLPRAVYTSGKASSAAGLTASVVKDTDTGEFNIEAGALMLADNGICCIDEFDKMDTKDQVAIHEAMEQQTISIAKAGIHATLNARTSVLAAANPIGGRYDKSKTLRANLNITPPIMSRFDLFFVVLDECEEKSDFNIAQYIVMIHQKKDSALKPDLSTAQLQRYITFARSIKPQISPEAAKLLVTNYRKLRQSDIIGHGRTSYRITVRQLESMIRLSEALARLHLDEYIREEYVVEAAQLLRKSIIHVETADIVLANDAAASANVTFSSNTSTNLEEEEEKEKKDTESSEEIPLLQRDRARRRRNSQENTGTTVSSSGSSAPTAKGSSPDSREMGNASKRPATLSISFEKYTKTSNMLAHHLKKSEGESLKIAELIHWYIEQVQDDLHSEKELRFERTLIGIIINRLIEKDKVLIVVEESNTHPDQRSIILNPNYELDK